MTINIQIPSEIVHKMHELGIPQEKFEDVFLCYVLDRLGMYHHAVTIYTFNAWIDEMYQQKENLNNLLCI